MSRVLSLTDEQRDQIARESLDHGQLLDSAFAAGVEAAADTRDYIPQTDPKPGTWWEYGIMRPATMPSMSGKPQWTQIVGATFPTLGQAEQARRRVPSLRGVPATICRRLVSDWEETS